MAKLYFRYGSMNCGKSSALMQVAYNYNENEKEVVVIKSSIDTKGGDYLDSRIGLKRKVDLLIDKNGSFKPYFDKWKKKVACILVDEAQFLTSSQVEELWHVAKIYDIPVICYGIRTNFQSKLFEGSKRLLELADELDELITICRCGKKAKFSVRLVDGKMDVNGSEVVIDGTCKNVEYVPLCGKCYLEMIDNTK